MNNRKVIFVSGTARSGSTMLDVMFGSGSENLALGEVYAHYQPWKDSHITSPCPCGNNNCSVRSSIISCSEENFHEQVFQKTKFNVLSDSSKTMDWVYPRFKELKRKNIDVVHVVIYKDPISLAHSFFKRGQPFSKWIDSYKYYKKLDILGLPYVSVNYDQLIKDLPLSFERLCNLLEVEYFEEKEKFWQDEIHHFFGSASVRKLYNSSKQKFFYTEKFVEGFEETKIRVEQTLRNDRLIQSIYSQLKRKDILANNLPYLKLSNRYQHERSSFINAILHPSTMRFTAPSIYKMAAPIIKKIR